MIDLTFAIPFQNSAKTLPAVVASCFSQNFVPKILLCDNGSKDGCRQMVDYWLSTEHEQFKTVKLITAIELAAGRSKNISFVRYHLCNLVKSEFIFLLDSDVLLPPFVVSNMVDFMNSAENFGCLGLRCEPLSDHVQFGCCLMRTIVARKIKWQQSHTAAGEFRCECWHAKQEVEAMDLIVQYFPDSQARHLKYF